MVPRLQMAVHALGCNRGGNRLRRHHHRCSWCGYSRLFRGLLRLSRPASPLLQRLLLMLQQHLLPCGYGGGALLLLRQRLLELTLQRCFLCALPQQLLPNLPTQHSSSEQIYLCTKGRCNVQ